MTNFTLPLNADLKYPENRNEIFTISYRILILILICQGSCLAINIALPGFDGTLTENEDSRNKPAIVGGSINPADFFSGALARPIIEIIKPSNGEVMKTADVEIVIEIKEYELPSPLHDSRICLGLACDGKRVLETCFEQTNSLNFVAAGLYPGKECMLQVVLFERSNALAMSVHQFSIAGVALPATGDEPSQRVSIKTAFQVAVEHHMKGAHSLAETIYHEILDIFPQHADALHLLGIIHLQKGDPDGAIDLIQKAVEVVGVRSTGLEGVLVEGSDQSANFHNSLAECLRAVGRIEESIEHYQKALVSGDVAPVATYKLGLAFQQLKRYQEAITFYSKVLEMPRGPLEDFMLRDARVRLCDLRLALGDLENARACWEKGIKRWPKDGLMYNELGNVHIRGPDTDENLNLAKSYYESAFHFGHVIAELNIAVVLELMGKVEESKEKYQMVTRKLKTQNPDLPIGHILIKAATVLPRLLPWDPSPADLARQVEANLDNLLGMAWDRPDNTEPLVHAFKTGYDFLFYGTNNAVLKQKLARVYAQFCPALLSGNFITEANVITQSIALPSDITKGFFTTEYQFSPKDTYTEENVHHKMQPRVDGPPRIGFLSRFFTTSHAVGKLSLGLIANLPKDKYEIYVFIIELSGTDEQDPIRQKLLQLAFKVFLVPLEIKLAIKIVKEQNLDILIFPEVGLDPFTYFVSFARMAPVQAAWWGHADTTGVPGIDYFITSTIESPGIERRYSEKPYLMEGLGAFFYRPQLEEDINTDFYRNLVRERLNLPNNFRLYFVPQALERMHPEFIDTIAEILDKDKLGYMLIQNTKNEPEWFHEFERRYGNSRALRCLFFSVSGEQEMLSLIEASEMVLNSFPVAYFYSSLQAFSLGVPVITQPGELLASRLTLAMYTKMGIADCIASNRQEYVRIALSLAFNTGLRNSISSRILASSYKVFEDEAAIIEWEKFFSKMSNIPVMQMHSTASTRTSNGTPKEINVTGSFVGFLGKDDAVEVTSLSSGSDMDGPSKETGVNSISEQNITLYSMQDQKDNNTHASMHTYAKHEPVSSKDQESLKFKQRVGKRNRKNKQTPSIQEEL